MQAQAEDDYLDGQGDDPARAEREAREEMLSKLDGLSTLLAKDRSDAIAGRASCGIEKEWTEDEEFYEGIDDANRNEVGGAGGKPIAAGSTFDAGNNAKPTGSTVFPNITRPYVDAAAARTADMLLPTDDVAWRIDPTPVAELAGIADGNFPSAVEAQIKQENPDPGAFEAKKTELSVAVAQQVKEAQEKAGNAEKQIQDWHVECQYHAHVRRVIEDTSRIGTGVLKGPVPMSRRQVAFLNNQLVIRDDLKPVSMRIDPWNFYPDPACGEDIQNGSFAMDRDDITGKKLKELIPSPGFIKEQIEKCLEEGPHEAGKIGTNNETGLAKRDSKNLYEIWYYYGQVKAEDYKNALQIRMGSEPDNAALLQEEMDTVKGEMVYIQAAMVNNHIIRLVQNHLDTGEFPYDVMVWQQRRNLPYGIGVARQVRTAQRIVIAGWRNMLDNAGRAAGPQVIVNDEYIVPENNIHEFVPFKVWRLIKPLDGQMRMSDVFSFVKIDSAQMELAAIIEMGLRLGEDATGLPMIMQGQTNAATPDTVGGMQMQDNNASTVLRRIARLFDDKVTERHIRRYYTHLLQYGEDNCKGDFTINAMGSSALVERAIQSQNIIQLGAMSQNPIYNIDPKKWAAEYLKSMRLDATRFSYDDDEWKALVQKMQQPAANPALEVAQIREKGATDRKGMELESRENVEAFKSQTAMDRLAKDQEFQLLLEQQDQDVTAFCEQMENGRLDKQLKTKIAETAAKLRTQIQMNAQVITPPTEPAGRAPAGQAFQK